MTDEWNNAFKLLLGSIQDQQVVNLQKPLVFIETIELDDEDEFHDAVEDHNSLPMVAVLA